MCKVSIVVPVYNVAQFLPDTLASLTGQTLREIEILCYDDCSTDESGAILDRAAAADPRVKVVHYPDNRTAAQARKDGALAAKGEYILYVDGDDQLTPDACEKLSRRMDETGVDMIHFGTRVEHDATLPRARIAALEALLKPWNGRLEGEGLLDDCFVRGKYHFQIWNKIFRAEVCRRAMREFPDGRFSKAQDAFAFFLIAFFARSYIGVPDETYYVYCFGRGVTGHQTLSRSQIVRYAEQALVPAGVRAFLRAQGALERCAASMKRMDEMLTVDSFNQLAHHVAPEDAAFAFDAMCGHWGAEKVVTFLAQRQPQMGGVWAQRLHGSQTLRLPPREARRIGAFYHSIANGGAQRVVAALATIWVELGHEVVLFTDSAPSEKDYPLPAGVERVVLPAFDVDNGAVCGKRCAMLHEAVKEHRIDLLVHHAWLNPCLFWDMLAAKTAGALVYVHTHSVFSMPLMSKLIKHRFFELPHVYALLDGVMTLSDTDAAYWRHFNSRVFTVKNPMTFDLDQVETSPLGGKTLLWLGRLSEEKRPVDAVDILAGVSKRHPDARLLVVGSGDPAIERALKKRIRRLKVEGKVELCGFHKDVETFYRRADVFLSTADYEGFSLTMLEAMSHGVPCLTYAMPYLTILETGKGSVSVPMGDTAAAARQICALFEDRERLYQAGREARENVTEQCATDFAAQWRRILDSASQPGAPVRVDPYEQRMLQTLMAHAARALKVSSSELEFLNVTPRGRLQTYVYKAKRVIRLHGWRVFLTEAFKRVKRALAGVLRR